MMFNANAMVQSAFLFAGFIACDEATYDACQMGQIEAAQHVAPWAQAIANALQYLENAPCDFPGVFEYEVTEYFGKTLCECYGQTDTYLAQCLIDSMREFFAQGDGSLNECQLLELGGVIRETLGAI